MSTIKVMREQLARQIADVQTRLRAQMLPENKSGSARHHINAPHNLGDAIADAVVGGMGSWRFIIIQTAIVALWIVTNVIAWALRFDPFPFILLNLVFSTQAAYASPLILMAANRSAAKDRMRDDHEAVEVDQLFQINQQQLQILEQQSAILDALHQLAQRTPGAGA